MRICLQLFTHLVTLNRSEGKRFVGKLPSELMMVLVMLLGGASFNAIIASSDTVFISNSTVKHWCVCERNTSVSPHIALFGQAAELHDHPPVCV